MIYHKTPRTWLQEGLASRLSAPISDAFDAHLVALPWDGTTGLDWSRMPQFSKFDAAGRSPVEVYQWTKTTRVGRRSHIAIWYSRKEGGIIVPLRAGIEALDELFWDAPGLRFAFGVEVRDGSVQPFFDDIFQYGNGDVLVATT